MHLSRASLLLSALVVLFWPVSRATAALPNEVEPEYSQAVIYYNAKDYDAALKMLNEIQKKAPKSTEILELKAITFKGKKDEKEAGKVYRELIQLKTKEGKDKKELAPYSFELGVIRYGEKNWKQAEQYLTFSAKYGFNTEVSNFYLGLIHIQTQEWSKAEVNFKDTIASDLEELRAAAHYYLAQVEFKLGYPPEGLANLVEARRTAQKYIDRTDVQPESKKMAEQVKQAAEATLAPFDKSQVFGSFSLLTGYDSNVLLMPSESGAVDASGRATVKTLLSAGFGYASSPMAKIQYVPSVRFNVNKNFNGSTSTGEFADTTFSLYLTKDALAKTAFGLKTEGGLVFQNQTDTSGAKKYRLYDSTVLLAPYVKWDASKTWSFGSEVGYKMVSYSGEESVSATQKRSGNVISFKVSAQNKANRKYFNPTFVARTELTETDGTEYDATLMGFQVINSLKLRKFDFSQVLGVDRTTYGSSSTDRKDTLLTLALLASKKIGPRWALLLSGDYSKNTSTDETSYSYTRYTLNVGLGYNF